MKICLRVTQSAAQPVALEELCQVGENKPWMSITEARQTNVCKVTIPRLPGRAVVNPWKTILKTGNQFDLGKRLFAKNLLKTCFPLHLGCFIYTHTVKSVSYTSNIYCTSSSNSKFDWITHRPFSSRCNNQFKMLNISIYQLINQALEWTLLRFGYFQSFRLIRKLKSDQSFLSFPCIEGLLTEYQDGFQWEIPCDVLAYF